MGKCQVPPSWAAAGARFDRELLYLPEWRRGFTVAELRALFWECQQVASLRVEVKNLTSTVEHQAAELERVRRRAWWLRSQLVLESRLGMALARLHS